MKNRATAIIFGILLIAAGVIFGGNAIGIFDINIFFRGWWTLFIIIPCIISMFTNRPDAGNIIGLLIGVAFLLSAQGLLSMGLVFRLVVPAILVAIGISLIFRPSYKKVRLQNPVPADTLIDYTSVFSSQKYFVDSNQPFYGGSLTSVFAGIDLDLRNAKIEQDIVITATVMFGGIDIFVPQNVRVKVNSTPIFGGISNKAFFTGEENAPTIYLNGTCVFGGIDVK